MTVPTSSSRRSPRPGPSDSPAMERWLQDSSSDPRVAVAGARHSVLQSRPSAPSPYQYSGTSELGNNSRHTPHGSLVGMTNAATSDDMSVATCHVIGAMHNRTLVVGQGDVLEVPRPESSLLECPFDRLSCKETFRSFDKWLDHSLVHFKQHSPPANNQCCFCPATFVASTGFVSWRARLIHVAKAHHMRGERLAISRCDTELFRYMWKIEAINIQEYGSLTGGPVERGGTPVIQVNDQTRSRKR
jgi:hypothetical protein